MSKNAEAPLHDATMGRYVSKDPIGFAGGDVNLYSYVGMNQINNVDPFGLAKCCIGGQQGQWRGGATRAFNIWCRCYWLCVPPEGTIWNGDWTSLRPVTDGVLINSGVGAGARRGNACFCPDPSGATQVVPLVR